MKNKSDLVSKIKSFSAALATGFALASAPNMALAQEAVGVENKGVLGSQNKNNPCIYEQSLGLTRERNGKRKAFNARNEGGFLVFYEAGEGASRKQKTCSKWGFSKLKKAGRKARKIKGKRSIRVENSQLSAGIWNYDTGLSTIKQFGESFDATLTEGNYKVIAYVPMGRKVSWRTDKKGRKWLRNITPVASFQKGTARPTKKQEVDVKVPSFSDLPKNVLDELKNAKLKKKEKQGSLVIYHYVTEKGVTKQIPTKEPKLMDKYLGQGDFHLVATDGTGKEIAHTGDSPREQGYGLNLDQAYVIRNDTGRHPEDKLSGLEVLVFDIAAGKERKATEDEVVLTRSPEGDKYTVTFKKDIVGARIKGVTKTKEGKDDVDYMNIGLTRSEEKLPPVETATVTTATVAQTKTSTPSDYGLEFIANVDVDENASVGENAGQIFRGKSPRLGLAAAIKHKWDNLVAGVYAKFGTANITPTQQPTAVDAQGNTAEVNVEGITDTTFGGGLAAYADLEGVDLKARAGLLYRTQSAKRVGPGGSEIKVNAESIGLELGAQADVDLVEGDTYKLQAGLGLDFEHHARSADVNGQEIEMNGLTNAELGAGLKLVKTSTAWFLPNIGAKVVPTWAGNPQSDGGDGLYGTRAELDLGLSHEFSEKYGISVDGKLMLPLSKEDSYKRAGFEASLGARFGNTKVSVVGGLDDVSQNYDMIDASRRNAYVGVKLDLLNADLQSLLDSDDAKGSKF